MTDLTKALSAEIARSSTAMKRLSKNPNGRVYIDHRPINRARAALASGDTVAMQASLDDLKGYKNDD